MCSFAIVACLVAKQGIQVLSEIVKLDFPPASSCILAISYHLIEFGHGVILVLIRRMLVLRDQELVSIAV